MDRMAARLRMAGLIGSAALLAACHGDSSGPTVAQVTPKPHARAPAKGGRSPEELTAGMVEAVTMGKSTVPVAVKFDLPQKPLLNQPFEVTIAVMPQIQADPATVLVTGSEALTLAPGNTGAVDIPSVQPAEVYRQTVRLISAAEGVQLLGVSVTLKHDEMTETRVFSVPVIVTAAPAAGAAGSPAANLAAAGAGAAAGAAAGGAPTRATP